MKVTKHEYEKNKWQLIGEFEVGKSGTYEQRILVNGLSGKKAEALRKQYDTGRL